MALVAALAMGVCATTADAKIERQAANGFALSHETVIQASPETIWAAVISPSRWWSPAHSYSGDAANFRLGPAPGGCFCETLPNGGSVEHARVIMLAPWSMLRLSGAFGPLQGEALTGTLTITLKPADKGTSLRFDYVVGGYARFDVEQLAPAVDTVIGEQHARLARLVATGRADETAPAK